MRPVTTLEAELVCTVFPCLIRSPQALKNISLFVKNGKTFLESLYKNAKGYYS